MVWQDYLNPLSAPSKNTRYRSNQWGNLVERHLPKHFPNLTHTDIALIGVDTATNIGKHANQVRNCLYQLYNWDAAMQVADLGNIKTGANFADACCCLQEVCSALIRRAILPIIIGESHALCTGQFEGHAELNASTNVVVFDRKVDLLGNAQTPDEHSFLYQLLEHKKLGHFVHAAHQRCFLDPQIQQTLEESDFECYSLGQMRPLQQEAEPFLRKANMVSFDLSCIRFADAPAVLGASAGGLEAEEAFALSRYAGMSNAVHSIGFYGFDASRDTQQQTAQLVAQLIWYFTEGFYQRKSEFPEKDSNNWTRYIVPLKDADHDIVFFKSPKTDRWWMQIPDTRQTQGHVWEPCSYSDYQVACHGEIPDRWLKVLMRAGK